MPRFDPDGNVVAGYSQISYNRQVIYPGAGGKAWSYSGDAVVANLQMPDGTWAVATIWLEGGPPIAEGPGANFLAGGNSRWLASNPGSGMYGALPSQTGREGVLGANTDGDLAYHDYPSGLGLTLVGYNGEGVEVPDAAVLDLQVISATQAIWYEGAGRVRSVGIPVPQFALTPEKVRRVVTKLGEVWLLYWSPQVNQVVLHLDGAKDGYFLTSPGEPAYNRDMVVTPADALMVCWSRTSGEAPGDLVVQTIDLTQPRVPLVAPAPPALTPPTRPLWFGFYEFQTRPQGPGSCALLVRNCSGPFPRPIIVDSESLNCVPGNLILGQLVAESSVPATEALAAQVAVTQRPVAYWDGNAWPSVPRLPKGSWITQRMYQPAGQSDADFLTAQEAQLRVLAGAGYPIVLVPQVFDTNGELSPTPFPTILQLAFTLADAFPGVVGVVGFSGFGREAPPLGGLDAHPDWLHACQVVAAQISAPVFTPWVTTPFPAATPIGATMKVYLKDPKKGTYVGISPTPVPGKTGDAAYPVYDDRTVANGWEAVDLVQQSDGRFLATFVDANRVLSTQPDGSWQSRVAGTYGGYENHAATTQPSPDVVNFLYRLDGEKVLGLLVIEEVP